MEGPTGDAAGRPGGRWRGTVWGGAAILLLLPLAATGITDQMDWGAADFALLGVLLVAACGAFELAARAAGGVSHRAAVAVALAAALLLVWMNLAVGLIGSEDHPANLLYAGVLAVGVGGAVVARLRPRGMARALVATALAQALVAVAALAAGLGSAPVVAGVTAIFVAMWLASAWLFRRATRDEALAGAA